MAPASKDFRILEPVACGHVSGLWLRPWPQALMGSVDRSLIMVVGSRGPNDGDRSGSIRRLTDNAIMVGFLSSMPRQAP
jgi:hypothetical protein